MADQGTPPVSETQASQAQAQAQAQSRVRFGQRAFSADNVQPQQDTIQSVNTRPQYLTRPVLPGIHTSHTSSHPGSHYEADEKQPNETWRISRDSKISNPSDAGTFGRTSRQGGHYVLTDQQIDNWHIYRDLIGLSDPPHLDVRPDLRANYLKIFKTTPEQTKNLGVYQRIIDEELRAHVWYRGSTWTTNILLMAQLSLAAAITALGGASGSNYKTVITTLGALNTVIAAVLTYFKAKGLPGSALQYRDKLRKQKAEIDYMHRAFCVGTADVSAQMAADRAEDDFNKASNQFEASIATLSRQATGLGPKTPVAWKRGPSPFDSRGRTTLANEKTTATVPSATQGESDLEQASPPLDSSIEKPVHPSAGEVS